MNPTNAPAPSIAACGNRLGASVEHHLDGTFRAMMRGDAVVSNDSYIRLLTGQPHPFANFALVRTPADPHATMVAIEPLRTCGAPAAAIFTGAVSAEVDERLRASGFHPHDPMPAMAVEIERLPRCALPAGYEFARIDPSHDGTEWSKVFAEGYELPPALAEVFSPRGCPAAMGADAPMQCFAVRKAGRQVATTLLYLNEGLAGIYCVATIPSERRQGLGAYLTVEALRAAHRLDYRVGVLQASPAGYPIYQRLGFADFGAVPMYLSIPTS